MTDEERLAEIEGWWAHQKQRHSLETTINRTGFQDVTWLIARVRELTRACGELDGMLTIEKATSNLLSMRIDELEVGDALFTPTAAEEYLKALAHIAELEADKRRLLSPAEAVAVIAQADAPAAYLHIHGWHYERSELTNSGWAKIRAMAGLTIATNPEAAT